MSEQSTDFDVDRLLDLIGEADDYVLKFKEAIVEGDSESDIVELAEDLWKVLDEVEDVLNTIDFEEIPEAIDVDELPETVDVEDVPAGILDEDESAIELTSVKEAINLRELWDAVDLTDLYQEKQELEEKMDSATDSMGDEDGLMNTDIMSDDDEDGMFEDVVDMGEGAHVQFDAETRQAFIEEKIKDAVEKFRVMLLTTHEKLEKLYHANQKKLGQPDRQPKSLNPTAISTLPSGPVPETASLSTSTVPSQVKYSRIANPRRIYAHRFHEATEDDSDDSDESEGAADEDEREENTDADDSGESGSGEGDDDEEITLEVHDE